MRTRPEPRLARVSAHSLLTGALPTAGLLAFLVIFGEAQTDASNRYWLQLGIRATTVATSVIGLNLLLGYTGLLSIGHYAFFVYGGYVGAVWAVEDWGLDPWLGFPVAFAAGAVLGTALALTCCHLRGFYLTVVTLAFGLLASALARVFDGAFGAPSRSVVEPLDTNFSFIPATSPSRPYVGLYWISAALLVLCTALAWVIVRGRWGRAYMAVRESELAARACGVPTYRTKVSAFALSAAIVSVAGVVAAQQDLLVQMADPPAMLGSSFELVIDAVIGGLGTIAGPIVGAFTLTLGLGVDVGGESLSEHLGEWETAFLAALVVGAVILAPGGIVGLVHRVFGRATRGLRPAPPVSGAVATPRPRQALERGATALELVGVTHTFGALAALADVDVRVGAGTVHALIGPNGSGKSTLVNVVTGVHRPRRGRVVFAGTDVTGASSDRVLRSGVARTFQTCQIWRRMTVLENVMVGAHTRGARPPTWPILFGGFCVAPLLLSVFLPPFAAVAVPVVATLAALAVLVTRANADAAGHALGLLRFVGLATRAVDAAGSLPFVDQRRLEIARALASDPEVLILDEPAAGMHPGEVRDLVALVRRIGQTGTTVVLIEHHMEVVRELADRVTVLNFGRVIAEGTPEEISADPLVIDAYLGEEREPATVGAPAPARVRPPPGASDAGDGQVPAALLSVRRLDVRYGAAAALIDVSIDVGAGEVVALIGANGAGKTTLLKSISGVSELLRSSRGEIVFEGRRIDRWPAHRIARAGMAHVPEGRRVFPESTVEENLLLGGYSRADGEPTDLPMIFERFPVLADRRHQAAGSLSGGEQQMLAIGRALAAEPKCLLLDEPSLGLAPIVVDEVFEIIEGLAREHVTILIVEQLATRALAVADRAYILETGSIARTGPARELAGDPDVKAAYLGG